MADPEPRPSRPTDDGAARVQAWLLGPGLLAVHVGAYLASATVLILVNLLRSPTDLWFWGPLRGWGLVLVFHAAFVAVRAVAGDLLAATARPSARGDDRPVRSEPAAIDEARYADWGQPIAAGEPGGVVRRAGHRRRSAAWLSRSMTWLNRVAAPAIAHARGTARMRHAPTTARGRGPLQPITAAPPVAGWTAAPVASAMPAAHPGRLDGADAATVVMPVATAPPPRPANGFNGVGRTESGPDPLHVPSLFVLRRDTSATIAPGQTRPRRAEVTPAESTTGGAPSGEDIVVAGPSPLDARDPNLDWAWMEAAAAAWIALREVDVAPAPPADGDRDPPIAARPGSAPHQQAGAG